MIASDSLREILEAFLSHLQHERGHSRLTILTYRRQIDPFSQFARRVCRRSWEEVTTEDVQAWLMEQKKRGRHINTLYVSVAALRAFFQFTYREKLSRDFSEMLDLPKRWEGLPHALAASEITRLLNAANVK